MEDARMEWNGRFQNGMEDNLPYFHTNSILDFCIVFTLYLPKKTYRCRVVINNIVTEVFNFNIYAYYLSTKRGTLVVYIALTAYVLHHTKCIAICSSDAIVDDFDKFDLLFFCFFFVIDKVLNFVFVHHHENSNLLFHSGFSLILFIFSVFQLTIILFGVKAWYFYYGKCIDGQVNAKR